MFLVVVLVIAAMPTAPAQPDTAPCRTDGQPANDTTGDSLLRVRWNVTHDDVVGWLCVYRGDHTLLMRPGYFDGPDEYTYDFINYEPGPFTAEFHIEGGILSANAADTIDLAECVRARGEIVLNLTHQTASLVGASSHAHCLLGNVTADASGSGGPGPGGDSGPDETRLIGSSWTPTDEASVAIGVGVGGLAAVLLVIRHWAGVHVAFAALFGRRITGDPADHPIRRRVVEVVEAEPGLHANAIAERLALAQGQTAHHLRILVRHDVLDSMKVQGRRRFFPGGRFGKQEKLALATLRRRHARKVYDQIAEAPSRPLSAIARDLGVAPSTVSKIVKELRRAELVEGEPLRSTVRTRPLPPAVRGAFARVDD